MITTINYLRPSDRAKRILRVSIMPFLGLGVILAVPIMQHNLQGLQLYLLASPALSMIAVQSGIGRFWAPSHRGVLMLLALYELGFLALAVLIWTAATYFPLR